MDKGQRVYNQRGEMATYVGGVDGKHVVLPIQLERDYEGEERECEGVAVVWDRAFAEPPQPKLAKACEREQKTLDNLQAQVAAAHKELFELRQTIRLGEQERCDLRKKLADVPALKRIDDFVAGRITHFAMIGGYSAPCVRTIKEATTDKGEHSWSKPEVRLVSLLGDSNGNLLWQVNRYRDGSGSWESAVPCASEEEARALCAEDVRTRLMAWKGPGYNTTDLVKMAEQYGVPVPAAIAEARDQFLKNVVTEREKDVQKAQKLLLEAQQAAASTTPRE